MKKQEGTVWTDHKGSEIPTYAINPVLKAEERHSHKIAKAALKAEEALRKVVELVTAAYEEVYNAKLIDAKIKDHKPPTDGMTICSFDNSIEVKITKPDNITFDTTYTTLVREKFDAYFNSFEDSEVIQFLREIVTSLLYSPTGRIDMNKVLRLRKHRDRIQNSKKLSKNAELFIEAVDLFDKAIRTKPGTRGIYVSIKDENGAVRRIPLKYMDI
jgi:hypothetical protein